MLAESPEDRPNAKQMESRLERIVIKALTKDLFEFIGELDLGKNVFQTKLCLEKTRFKVWAGLLDLTQLGQQTAEPTSQLLTLFFKLFKTIKDTIKDTKARRFKSNTQNKMSILSSMH